MYTNQQVSSLADFISKLNTFLKTTVGTWTTFDTNFAGGEWAARKSGSGYDIALAAQWDTGTPGFLGLYQHLGVYSSGSAPYAQADDSGNGAASTSNASLALARHAAIGNTPVQFWCFEDDHYFHCVVEQSSGRYRHFGAGQLVKFGDWTGGEYVYGQSYKSTSTTGVSLVINNTFLLDGRAEDGGTPSIVNMEEYVATVHAEGLPNEGASSKWAVHMGNQLSTNLGNDRQGSPQPRIHFTWGYRAGPFARNIGRFDGSDLSGHLPFYPLVSAYFDRTTGHLYGPMGYMKDVRGASIRNYVGGQELTIGGDTWVIFPAREKWLSGAHTSTTDNQAIVYKKVTA